MAMAISSEKLKEIGWGICVFYILVGVGRGVFETTNKAALVNFFPGEQATAAFSNMHTWSGLAFGVAFIVFAYIGQIVMGTVLLVFSLASAAGIWRVYIIWHAEHEQDKIRCVWRQGSDINSNVASAEVSCIGSANEFMSMGSTGELPNADIM